MIYTVINTNIPHKEGEKRVNMSNAISEMLDAARAEGRVKELAENRHDLQEPREQPKKSVPLHYISPPVNRFASV